mgnify:CR=1 FL=1
MAIRPRGRKRSLSKRVSSFNMYMDQVYQIQAIMETTGAVKDAPVIRELLDEALGARITAAALAAFAAVGAEGVARVDFMVDTERASFVVNELNPIPGSLSFYLFEPAGLSFTALLDELIDIARRRHATHLTSTLVFEHWMLGGGGPKTSR